MENAKTYGDKPVGSLNNSLKSTMRDDIQVRTPPFGHVGMPCFRSRNHLLDILLLCSPSIGR